VSSSSEEFWHSPKVILSQSLPQSEVKILLLPLVAHRPGQTVRPAAGINTTDDFQGPQIDDRNITIRAARHIGTRTVGLHQDTCRSPSNFDPFDVLARARVEHGQGGNAF